MTNLDTMILELRRAFDAIERIDPCTPSYRKMVALLDGCDDEAIVTVWKSNIKFVSSLAYNRVVSRGLHKKRG